MRFWMTCFVVSVGLTAFAQTPQIPTLQVCNASKISGSGTVLIASRAATGITGTFGVTAEGIACDPAVGYPAGSVKLKIDLSDSFRGTVYSSAFEQLTSTGNHTPTAFMNGRCKAEPAIPGCRFWILVADNKRSDVKGTPDVVSFLVIDNKGKRIAYGTGPLRDGDLLVGPTSN